MQRQASIIREFMMKIYFIISLIYLSFLLGCRTKPKESLGLGEDNDPNKLSLQAKACSESLSESILAEGEGKKLAQPEKIKVDDLQMDAFRIAKTSMNNAYQFLSIGASAKNESAVQYFKVCVCDAASCESTKTCFSAKSHHLMPPLNQFDNKQVKVEIAACVDQYDNYQVVCGNPISQKLVWRPSLRAVEGLSKIDKEYQVYFDLMQDIDAHAYEIWKDSCELVNANIKAKSAMEQVYFSAAQNLCYSSSSFISSVLAFDFNSYVQLANEQANSLGDEPGLKSCHTKFNGLGLTDNGNDELPASLRIGFPTLAIGLSVHILGSFYGEQGWRGVASYAGFELGGRAGAEIGWRLGNHFLGWPGGFVGSIAGSIGGAFTGGFVGGRIGTPLYRAQFRRTRDVLIKEGLLDRGFNGLEAPKVDLSDVNAEQRKVLDRMDINNRRVGEPLKKYGGWSAFIGLIATGVGIVQLFSLTETPSISTYMAELAVFDERLHHLVKEKNQALDTLIQNFE